MAKFEPSIPLTSFSGTLNGSDRTIGIDKALAITMRKTKTGLILAKKPISVKNPSLAKKLRVKTYCNCDEGWKTLTFSELAELSILHLQYNLTHRHKPVKTLYHFWMKLCMSNDKTPLTNCSAIEADIINIDMESAKGIWWVGFAAQYTSYIPSIDTNYLYKSIGKVVISEEGILNINSWLGQGLYVPNNAPFSAMIKVKIATTRWYPTEVIRFGYLVDIYPMIATNPDKLFFTIRCIANIPNPPVSITKNYNQNSSHTFSFTYGRIDPATGHNCMVYMDGDLIQSFYSNSYGGGDYVYINKAITTNIKINSAAWHPTLIKRCSELINPTSPEDE